MRVSQAHLAYHIMSLMPRYSLRVILVAIFAIACGLALAQNHITYASGTVTKFPKCFKFLKANGIEPIEGSRIHLGALDFEICQGDRLRAIEQALLQHANANDYAIRIVYHRPFWPYDREVEVGFDR